MRALAEYVMRGRSQATVVAVMTAAIPLLFWISAAIVGLVTLRHGVRAGVLVLLWALLPAGVLVYFGEIMPAMVLIGVLILGGLLRLSASWPWTLCGAALLGLMLSGVLYGPASIYLAGVEKLFADLIAGLQQQGGEGAQVALVVPHSADIAGMFGLILSVMVVACLMIARGWQALLYNPGGFGSEFRSLHLAPGQVMGLLAVAMLLALIDPKLRLWAWLPLVPLLFAGLGLVHAILAARGKSGFLGLFYAALLMLPPLKQILVVLAAMDGWLDFRRRWL